MSFVPAIQSLISASVPGADTDQAPLDWNAGVIYPYNTSSAIARIAISNGVVEENGSIDPSTYVPIVGIDSKGILYNRLNLGNFTGVNATIGATLANLGTYGAGTSFDNQPNNIPQPGSFFASDCGPGLIWIATAAAIPIGTNQHSINILKGGGIPSFAGHNYSMTGGTGASYAQCPGESTGTTSGFYTVENLLSHAQVNIYQTLCGRAGAAYDPSTWPTPNAHILSTNSGTILPTDIDPSYGYIGHSGVAYDQTDGNLILNINAGVSSGSDWFIVKVPPTGGAPLWIVPWSGSPMENQMGYSSIKHGRYAVGFCSGGTKEIWIINTSTGAVDTITTNLNGMGMGGEQCFNDELGCIVAPVSYTNQAGAPIPLGNTPSSFTGWAALYVTNRVPQAQGGKYSYTKIWGAPAAL